MTHLPYIILSYVIAIGVPLVLSAHVLFRLRSAQRQLRAIDPREDRGRK